jgi:carbonic anhydrase/acetyltransferase-like protein (isoleucine patch superfamily)
MLLEFEGHWPRLGRDVYVATTAVLIGDVEVGDGCSIWFNAVIRADFGPIRIGRGCNIQDNATIHVFSHSPTIIHDNVTIGHNAVLEGCEVGSGTVVGMGAIILPYARIGSEVMVAAGSVVGEGSQFPARVLVAGAPAEVKKELSGAALDWIGRAAADYQAMQARYRAMSGVEGGRPDGAG